MDIIVKKTFELTEKEISKIGDLFEIVFNRKKSDIESFRVFHESNPKGYSYHALWYEDDKIIGHNVYSPFIYYQNNTPFYAVLSTGAMTHPDYRGMGGYKKIVEACEIAAKNDGCKLRIGFPNDNSYPIQKYKLKYTEIGSLSTYILPVRISCINPKLKIFDFVSILFSLLLIILSSVSCFSKKIYKFKYTKDVLNFDKYRYKWFGGNYHKIYKDTFNFCYKYASYEGKQAIFLLDVNPMSKENFDKAVRFIYNKEFSKIPSIIYVGNLKFQPFSMVRIPQRFEPKHFRFMAKPLDDIFIDEDYKDIKKWNINLSNFDLL